MNVQLLVFEDLEVPTHKTKNIVNYVNQMEDIKKLLLVDGGPIHENLKLATQNLHYVNVLPSIVSCDSILIPLNEFLKRVIVLLFFLFYWALFWGIFCSSSREISMYIFLLIG